jgi:ketosteroid isomerase-like protein
MTSAEDLEVITRMLHAWSSGDIEGLLEVFDPDVEVRPAWGAFLAAIVYRGHEGIRAWYEETNQPWAELHAEPERVIDAGGRTLAIIALHARVPGGHVDMHARIAHLVTIHDGKIVRLDGYEEPEAAMAAVGVTG